MSDSSTAPRGALTGVRVVEMAGIGPVPFCGMALADMGADVVRVDRTAASGLGIEIDPRFDCMARSKKSLAVDMKQAEGLAVVKRLLSKADIVIEGFRPGVMEKLGLSPDVCLALNPRLVYGRCSGWGDKGPLAPLAGHDINYLALSGGLAAMGVKGAPVPPLNLVGDFGGAAMHLLCGVLAGLLSARETGKGQVVAASISDGTVSLMPMIYGMVASKQWSLDRGTNQIDGGSPYYRTYETKDGRYVAIGSLEPKFYAELVTRLGLAGKVDLARQDDRATWPATIELFASVFKQKTRDEWSVVFAGSDACYAPVLEMSEAPKHPQQIAAEAFVEVDGVVQPVFGARFSVTKGTKPRPARALGADTAAVLQGLGFGAEEIAGLHKNLVVVSS